MTGIVAGDIEIESDNSILPFRLSNSVKVNGKTYFVNKTEETGEITSSQHRVKFFLSEVRL